MANAWHFLGSTTLQRLGKLTLREDAWRLPTGALRRYPVLHVGMTVGVVPSWTPSTCSWSASSAIWHAPTPGSCLAEADNRARNPRRQRSGSSRGRRLPRGAADLPHALLPFERLPRRDGVLLHRRGPLGGPLASDDDEFFERLVVPFPGPSSWRSTTGSPSRCPRSRSSPRHSSWASGRDCSRAARDARLLRMSRFARVAVLSLAGLLLAGATLPPEHKTRAAPAPRPRPSTRGPRASTRRSGSPVCGIT